MAEGSQQPQPGRHVRRTGRAGAHKNLATWQKATALLPLALLSGAWTTSMVSGPTADAVAPHAARLPDGTTIPTHPLKKPASVSAPSAPNGDVKDVAASAGSDGIPAVALAAYKHAAKVIDSADPACHLPWQLLAAIGRVESDHGRSGGSALGADGVDRPAVYGIPLDGANGTADIADTDGGRYDGSSAYDRAVGPMQFIPSTWSVVGVDGDGDGVRNPQDINDAALAAGVYLCAGQENLSTAPGREAAVYRYNHNQDYVDLVLAIFRSYLAGDYSVAPNGVTAPAVFAPARPATAGRHRATHPADRTRPATTGGRHRAGGTTTSGGGTGTGGGSTGGTSGGGTSTPTSPVPSPSPSPTQTVTSTVQDTVVGMDQAVTMCTDELDKQYGAAPDQAVQDCANQIVGEPLSQAQKDVVTVVAGLSDLVNSLLGGGGLLGGSTSGGSTSGGSGSGGSLLDGGGLLGGG